jgi:hypothetical protein
MILSVDHGREPGLYLLRRLIVLVGGIVVVVVGIGASGLCCGLDPDLLHKLKLKATEMG